MRIVPTLRAERYNIHKYRKFENISLFAISVRRCYVCAPCNNVTLIKNGVMLAQKRRRYGRLLRASYELGKICIVSAASSPLSPRFLPKSLRRHMVRQRQLGQGPPTRARNAILIHEKISRENVFFRRKYET